MTKGGRRLQGKKLGEGHMTGGSPSIEMVRFCLVSISLSSVAYSSIAVFMAALNNDYAFSFLLAKPGHATKFWPIVSGEGMWVALLKKKVTSSPLSFHLLSNWT